MHQKEKQYHILLAEYFMAQPFFYEDKNKNNPNTRKCIEQPWQQAKSEMWDRTLETLSDYCYIKAKVDSGMLFDLIADFDLIPSSTLCKIIQESLRLSISTLRYDFSQLPMQLSSRFIDCTDEYIQGILKKITRINKQKSWLKVINHSMNLAEGPLKVTLKGHSDVIKLITVFSNGRNAISASDDGDLKIWDIWNCREIHLFNENVGKVSWIGISKDNSFAVLKSYTRGTIVINLNNGCIQKILPDCHFPKMITTDDQYLVEIHKEKFIKVWNIKSGDLKSTIHLNDFQIASFKFTSDGKHLIMGSWDGKIRMIETVTGKEKARMNFSYFEDIHSISITPDGRFVLCLIGKGTYLKIVDLFNLSIIRVASSPPIFDFGYSYLGMEKSYRNNIMITYDGKYFFWAGINNSNHTLIVIKFSVSSGNQDYSISWDLWNKSFYNMCNKDPQTVDIKQIGIIPNSNNAYIKVSGSETSIHMWNIVSG